MLPALTASASIGFVVSAGLLRVWLSRRGEAGDVDLPPDQLVAEAPASVLYNARVRSLRCA